MTKKSPTRRVSLKELLGQTAVAYYAHNLDEHGRLKVAVRIDGHPLVELGLLRSGLVHYDDRPRLVPVALALNVPLQDLTSAIQRFAKP